MFEVTEADKVLQRAVDPPAGAYDPIGHGRNRFAPSKRPQETYHGQNWRVGNEDPKTAKLPRLR